VSSARRLPAAEARAICFARCTTKASWPSPFPKKAVLAAVDLAALAACIAAAFALVARIPALSALEVPSQAFWSVVFGLLLLVVAYLNDCLDIEAAREAVRRFVKPAEVRSLDLWSREFLLAQNRKLTGQA
jgi:hypothetical protein